MASKQTKTRLSPLERAELQARKLRADLEVMQLREAKKRLKGALNIHGAADRGRRNQDWMPGPSSADLAAIPDSTTLIPRARQLCRDSWIFRSAQKAFTRNVVGKGIVVTPHAKDRDGKPLTKLNKVAQMEFRRWATSAMACDVERRKTFPQIQRLATDEEFVVGEHLVMWVYNPPAGPDGRLDSNAPVGLRLQCFEPEQFDLRILSYEGREVRGGVEVDENGAAIAYHLYTRNPNDILYRHAFFSERVPRSRMFHYYKQDRVLQTRGVTRGAPVMNDIRDLERFRSATLWRCVMEACIGIIIKSPVPGGGGGPSNFFNPASGEQTQTSSGMSTADFVPGMVARPVQGEEIEPFIPQSPGNNYDPFTQLTVRGIGAGVGMSFGQIMRHSDGNYSAARQDMLEDRREWEPEQELIIDCLLRPVYELWFTFAASEGRFDGIEGFDHDEFLAERWRFVDADYIPPAQSWIDPEKEANAFAVLLQNRLITREEIVAMRGGRFYQTIEKIAAEQTETDALNLSLPENAAETAAIRDFIKQVVATHTGGGDAITLNATDIGGLLARARFPTREGYTAPLLPVTVEAGGVEVTGEPVENAEGQVIAGGMQPPPAPPAPPAIAVPTPQKGALDGNEVAPRTIDIGGERAPGFATTIDGVRPENLRVPLPVVPPEVPHYRTAENPAQCCATCSYIRAEQCTRFNFNPDPAAVCDAWRAVSLTENIGVPNVAKTFPPGPQQGQPDLESRFYSPGDEGAPYPNQGT